MINGREINTGVIRTGEGCQGCGRCVDGCPVFGANVVAEEKGKSQIYVDQTRCVQCGRCLTRCGHGARQYVDDTARMLRDLAALRQGRRKRPIAIVYDPVFLINYPDEGARVLSWLKSLGAEGVYSAAFGADIALWACLHALEGRENPGVIGSFCPAVVAAVESLYPSLTDRLMPVRPPHMCLAIYLRDQLGLETDVAFVSPCVASKTQIDRPESHSYVQYNVTFSQLMAHCADVNLSDFAPAVPELDSDRGLLLSAPGGLRESLALYLGAQAPLALEADGASRVYPMLEALAGREALCDGSLGDAGLIEANSCARGCLFGAGTQFCGIPLSDMPLAFARARAAQMDGKTPAQRLAELRARFEKLSPQTYQTTFQNRAVPLPEPDREAVDAAFHRLYKFTQRDQLFDCSACGYASCQEMARAVALGLDHPGNCASYLRTRLNIERAQAAACQQRLVLLDQNPPAPGDSRDPLTGLETRYAFEQRVEQALAAGVGGFVFGVDLDDFMTVNERYGHTAGNDLLVAIARYLRDELGSLCGIYRMSGDNFALVAEGADEDTANFITGDLLHKAREPWDIGGIRVFCTMSVGVAGLEAADSVSALVARVETAVDAAKNRGKNICVRYTPGLDKDDGSHARLLHQLRDDVFSGLQSFDVYYQPWVSCEGDLLGAEALARWTGSDGRFIPPPDFIPVAENAGLIIPLGDFILRRAAEQCRKANATHPHFTMSVNISVRQFSQPDFFERTMTILDETGVDKRNMILEITESLGFEDMDRQRALLTRLSQAGLQIAMDDFGTGYSSLSYLSELPLDLVKIDRSFIREIDTENYSKYMLTSMTDLMHKMGRKVVVEGVETRRQLDLCESFGVDIIQGFLFFRPMPAAQLTQLLSIS